MLHLPFFRNRFYISFLLLNETEIEYDDRPKTTHRCSLKKMTHKSNVGSQKDNLDDVIFYLTVYSANNFVFFSGEN